ncbi:MAG: twin-arginine translocase TatA/TatE family subunit [Anaerolineales bacterium]|nr:twin-arginine translocase TatA/TatE family subunit [Anaerolineales bacterium]MCX7608520.1 twin-arginine translocase TatA/TatE family subunit [Anaerolineales bacterium]MDW8227564.1 twin-arginine translocase TatA/TatE family subunit [Anaerolineales bacterium]
MNVFGLGLPEILFILFLILLIFGPQDLARTGRALGHFLNRVVRSQEWKMLHETGQTLKNLPRRLMREANLEEIQQAIDPFASVSSSEKVARPKEEESWLHQAPGPGMNAGQKTDG